MLIRLEEVFAGYGGGDVLQGSTSPWRTSP